MPAATPQTPPTTHGIPSATVRPKIRALLEREPHLLAEFADHTGWSEDLTRAWLRNARPVNATDIVAWSDVLDVPVPWLTGDIDTPLGLSMRLGTLDVRAR